MIDNLPLYNAILEEGDELRFISFVSSPAVKKNFIAFNNQLRFSVNDPEKHIVTGLVLLADTPIYRRDDTLGEYYVQFSPEVIRKVAERLFTGKTKVNLEHSEEVDNVVLQEIYIKDSRRNIAPKEFEDVPDGSLFATYKVNNPEVWEMIKNGEYQGFSIEGYFDLEEANVLEDILRDLKKLRNIK